MMTNEPRKQQNENPGSGDGRPTVSGRTRLAPRPTSSIEWAEVDNELIRNAIVAVADGGAAIMLGRTSDGGALSITVLDGKDKVREWPHDILAAEKTLRWIIDMFTSP